MTTPTLTETTYRLSDLADDVRAAVRSAESIPETVRLVRDSLGQLLANPSFLAEACPDFDPREGRTATIYKDPDADFVVVASAGKPGLRRPPHDHGGCWAVYGVYTNQVRMRRFRRLDDGSAAGRAQLETSAEWVAQPGQIDGILPDGIHELFTEGDAPAVSIIVRCHDLKNVWRSLYDAEAGTVRLFKGSTG